LPRKRISGRVVRVKPPEQCIGLVRRSNGAWRLTVELLDLPSEDWTPEAGMDFVAVFCKRKKKK
jgi:hypothetical protein